MCSLCGILGGRGHWTESAASPEVFAPRAARYTPGRERQERARAANRVLEFYGLSLSQWASTSYLLRNRTGQTVIVNDLSTLWQAAEALAKRPCDPLDDRLLAALDADD